MFIGEECVILGVNVLHTPERLIRVRSLMSAFSRVDKRLVAASELDLSKTGLITALKSSPNTKEQSFCSNSALQNR